MDYLQVTKLAGGESACNKHINFKKWHNYNYNFLKTRFVMLLKYRKL